MDNLKFRNNRGAGASCGALLAAAVLLAGCDLPRDVPELDVPQQQQGMIDESSGNPDQWGDRNGATQGGELSHKQVDSYTQQQGQLPDPNSSIAGDPGAQAMAQFGTVKRAQAEVRPLGNYGVNGTVTFTPAADNKHMEVRIELASLSPGAHGFHVHENGDCSSSDGMSAGDHHNPYAAPHGSPQTPPHHTGDLGNVEADENGVVATTITVSELAFTGPASVLERAVVVHAGPDDLSSQPAGNSGERVGCGVIRHEPEVLADSLKNPDPEPQ